MRLMWFTCFFNVYSEFYNKKFQMDQCKEHAQSFLKQICYSSASSVNTMEMTRIQSKTRNVFAGILMKQQYVNLYVIA